MRPQDQIAETLRAKGYRITGARKAILDCLLSATSPLSAADIHLMLRKRKLAADKVTVYREMEMLEKEGIVVPIQLQDRNRRYELASLDHHHHLICQNCHRIDDVELHDDFTPQERAIAQRNKFKVLRHSLEFFGLCQRCQ